MKAGLSRSSDQATEPARTGTGLRYRPHAVPSTRLNRFLASGCQRPPQVVGEPAEPFELGRQRGTGMPGSVGTWTRGSIGSMITGMIRLGTAVRRTHRRSVPRMGRAHRLHRRRMRAVGQDRRPRGRRRRARPGAPRAVPGPDGEPVTRARRRLPAALPERAGPARPASLDRRRRPRSARGRRRHDGPCPHRSTATATGSASSTTRRRSTGPAFYDHPDDAWRFGIFGRAALEALRADAAAGEPPVDILSVHDWHSGPALLDRAGRLAGDPVIGRAAAVLTIHNLAYHGWIPRGRPRASSASLPGDGLVAPGAVGHRPAVGRDRAGRARQHGQPGLRGRGAHPDLRASASTRRCGPRATASSGSSTASTRTSGTRPRTSSRRRRYSRGGPDRQGRLPGRPAHPASASTRTIRGWSSGSIGRLDPQKGFDLLARRRAAAARRRRPDRRAGQRRPGRSRRAFAPWPSRGPDQVAFIDRFDRVMARRIYAGSDAFAHAVAVRALRAGPDDRPALRDAAHRPRRPAACATRSSTSTTGRGRAPGSPSVSRRPTGSPGPPRRRWSGSTRGRRARSAGTPSWTAGWPSTSTGSVARRRAYLAAFRRAIGLRRAPKAAVRAANAAAKPTRAAGARRSRRRHRSRRRRGPKEPRAGESRVAPRYRSRGAHPGSTVGLMWRRSGSSSAQTWLVACPRPDRPRRRPCWRACRAGYRRRDHRRHASRPPSRLRGSSSRAATPATRSTKLHVRAAPRPTHLTVEHPGLREEARPDPPGGRRPRAPGAYDVAWDGRVGADRSRTSRTAASGSA